VAHLIAELGSFSTNLALGGHIIIAPSQGDELNPLMDQAVLLAPTRNDSIRKLFRQMNSYKE
jgi:hypothetical protein